MGTVRRLFHQKRTGRRQKESYGFYQYFRHRTVPCEVKVPLSARLAFAHIGRASEDFCLKLICTIPPFGARPDIEAPGTFKNIFTN